MTDTDVVERQINPIVELRSQLENMEVQFKNALPAHIPVERFMRVVLTAIQNNPDLLKADRKSLWNAAMKAAQDGLLPDGREGAMVVRKMGGGGLSITWQPMIAGIRKKARNSGEIATWDAHIVCAGDHFQFQLGDNPQINHSYGLQTERGAIIGAYSVCVLKDGTKSYEVMSIGEMYAIRDRSDAWKAFKAQRIKSTPWSTDEGEMCRKTVARRHSKVIPMSSDLDDLMRRDDELYNFDAAKLDAQANQPKSLAGKLDALAGIPASLSPPIGGEQTDADTGEVTETNSAASSSATGEPSSAGAAEAGQADPAQDPDKAGPATNSASSQKGASSAAPDASGQAAPESSNPPRSKGDGAATAIGGKGATPPENEAEFIVYAEAWIAEWDGTDEPSIKNPRWQADKNLRNKCNVTEEVRDAMLGKFIKKIGENVDANRD
jgi:recombination protein RecT